MNPIADEVVTAARRWIGTPYRHQGTRRGVGCDCLGLVRGVWFEIYGAPAREPGPYAPDWAETGSGEPLLDAVRGHCRERTFADMRPGDLLVFRWRSRDAAKHAGIFASGRSFIHAYDSAGLVVESPLAPQWRRRIAGVFAFPGRPLA